MEATMQEEFDNLPKQAQEGLEKLGEKIGDSEWDELRKEYLQAVQGKKFQPFDPFGWLKEHYFPPKSKGK